MKSTVALQDPPAPEAAVPATDKDPAQQPPTMDPEFFEWLEELL